MATHAQQDYIPLEIEFMDVHRLCSVRLCVVAELAALLTLDVQVGIKTGEFIFDVALPADVVSELIGSSSQETRILRIVYR